MIRLAGRLKTTIGVPSKVLPENLGLVSYNQQLYIQFVMAHTVSKY